MDFFGAAQSEGAPVIFYLSSDEHDHLDCISSGSVDDLVSSLDEETGNTTNGKMRGEAIGRSNTDTSCWTH